MHLEFEGKDFTSPGCRSRAFGQGIEETLTGEGKSDLGNGEGNKWINYFRKSEGGNSRRERKRKGKV